MTHRRNKVFVVLVTLAAGVLLVSLSLAVASLFPRELPSTAARDRAPSVEKLPGVRIAVAGDTGTGDAAERSTAQRMLVQGRKDPYDGLLLLGDLIYDDGDADLVDRVVAQPFAPIVDGGAELIPVLGNHDYMSDQQTEILDSLGRQSPWYVARVGSVRVVVDSNRVGDPEQTRWLRDILAEPQQEGEWTIVGMHHPAYSAGFHGSDLAVRQAWSQMFKDADVPLVLAGHDHDYQRSVPQDGVIYVVSGAGAKLRPTGQEEFTAVSASRLHFLDLLFYDDRLVGRAIDQSGRLVDTFTITR